MTPLRLTRSQASDLASSLSEIIRVSKGSPIARLIEALAKGNGIDIDPR